MSLEARNMRDTTSGFIGSALLNIERGAEILTRFSAGKSSCYRMANEWYYIDSALKKDEQIRDLRRDLVFSDDDRFTVSDDVPIVLVNDEQDDFDGEDDDGL
jgi:hypothetical protein